MAGDKHNSSNANGPPTASDYVRSRAELLTEGYKGLLIVNGGGAAALLAFIAQIVDKSPRLAELAFIGVAFMAAGLGLALLIPFFRYHHSHIAQEHEAEAKTAGKKLNMNRLRTPFWYLYVGCEYLSVIAFIVALGYLVANALPLVGTIPPAAVHRGP